MTRPEIRRDFIQRLFAVAISVGVATSFVGMRWVREGDWPNLQEIEQLTVLFIGMVATVLSWDGYLLSIDSKPLNGTARFTIDVILVFVYMFFLISSAKPYLWLPILAFIFGLYVTWDILTVREHIRAYDASMAPAKTSDTYRAKISDVFRVYGRGLINSPATERGPIISLMWASYFLYLALLNYCSVASQQVFIFGCFAFVGLIFYRLDKSTVLSGSKVRGYRMGVRVILILALIVLVTLCVWTVGTIRFSGK